MPVLSSRFAAVAAAAATAVLICTGCSDDATPAGEVSTVREAAEQAEAAGYDNQASILKDGTVTSAEYRDAVDAQIACLREAGIDVSEPILSLADQQRFSYTLMPSQGMSTDSFDTAQNECYARTAQLVEEQYLITNGPQMDPALLNGVTDCLEGLGVELSGNEVNIPELQDAPGNATREQLAQCIPTVGERLYPGIPIPYAFSF